MNDELRDVLAGAEGATARALPEFDPTVMARVATRRSKRRRMVRSAGTSLAALVAVGGLAVGAFAAADKWGNDPGHVTPAPSVTAAPTTGAPVPTPGGDEPLPGHTVTTGDGLPSARALSQDALDAQARGWLVTVFDSTFRGTDGTNVEGERVLYLVSPAGERWEIANLTSYDSVNVQAWDVDRGLVFLSEDSNTAVIVDIAAGTVADEWEYCGEGTWITVGAAGGGWSVRGGCSGSAIDGLYDDAGGLVTADGYVRSENGVTVTMVGDVQAVYEFEREPELKFRAVSAAGVSSPMQVPADSPDCYPMAAGVGAVVAQCYGNSDGTALWALPIDGGAPVLLGDQDLADLGGELVDGATGAMFAQYCLAGDLGVYGTQGEGSNAVFVRRGGPQLGPNAGEFVPKFCITNPTRAVLVTGAGSLWSWEPDTDAVTVLVPVPEPGDDGRWVGVGDNGVIVHP